MSYLSPSNLFSGSDIRRRRLKLLGSLAIILLLILTFRLWYLQVLSDNGSEARALANSTHTISVLAPRGRILDINGKVLAESRVINSIAINSNNLTGTSAEEQEDLADNLLKNLPGNKTSKTEILRALGDSRYGPFDFIPLITDISDEQRIYLAERPELFPGMEVIVQRIRTYPYGSTAAHLVGYIGRITQAELNFRQNIPQPYSPNDDIGKVGIEHSFENDLRGVGGFRRVSTDASLNILEEIFYEAPVPGRDIQLTIDIDLQMIVEEELARGLEEARLTTIPDSELFFPAIAGAAVVLDPNGSKVLAMASYPTYNPQEFIGGISLPRFIELNQTESNSPLINRAIQGIYSPGSSIKPITAYSALSSGLIGENGFLGVNEQFLDTGTLFLEDCEGKCEFSNPDKEGKGRVDLRRAITISSDVYFYSLAQEMGTNPRYGYSTLLDTYSLFGFGESTSVALNSESLGLVPTPDEDWVVGDLLNVAIGQGDFSATPLQLANAYGAIANEGTLYSPQVANAVLDPLTGKAERTFANRVIRQIDMPSEIRTPILDGMKGVTTFLQGPTGGNPAQVGTAYSAFLDFPHSELPLAAKTGTVQVEDKTDTAVFVAFGLDSEIDAKNSYVMTVIMEESGFGGEKAAPVVRRTLERWLE